MKNTIVTYETFHGSAKKVAEIISGRFQKECLLWTFPTAPT